MEGPSATALLAAYAERHRARVLDNAQGAILGRDPEHLHRMRTSSRRLRSALKLCRGALPKPRRKALERELAWLARALGEVRDLDVMLEELPRLLGEQPALEAWLQGQLFRTRVPLPAALESERFATLARELTWLAQPGHGGRKADRSAALLLEPRIAALRDDLQRQARAVGADSSDDQLHRLRILGKRLRYGCELALPALPVEGCLAPLRRVHLLLGAHQDAAVGEAWLRRWGRSGAPVETVQACIQRLARERLALRGLFGEALPDLLAALN